jgi:hypothetical protein
MSSLETIGKWIEESCPAEGKPGTPSREFVIPRTKASSDDGGRK